MKFYPLCKRFYLVFTSVLLLSACGGGGLSSDGDNNPPAPPTNFTVDVGSDQSVNQTTTLNLSATLTGQFSSPTFSWTVTPELADSISHPDTQSSDAVFTAPEATEQTVYTLTLTATENGFEAQDSMVVTVLPDNAPTTSDFTVDIGDDQTINEESTVSLFATLDGNFTNPTYSWTMTPEVTGAITHSDNTSAAATFAAPKTSTELVYTLTLRASENGFEASDEMLITVVPVNVAPVAHVSAEAVANYAANEYPGGIQVNFKGDASADPDSSETLIYEWSQVSGTDISSSFTTPNAANTSITTPNLATAEELVFVLTVTDNDGAKDTANLKITVVANDKILPTVNAGQDRSIFAGESIILNAVAATTATNATPFTYLWEPASDTEVQLQPLPMDTAPSYAVAPNEDTVQSISFKVTATDSNGNSASDTVTFTVSPHTPGILTDTGLTSWTDNTNITTAPIAEFPGQDADYGRSIFNANHGIEKQGAGDSALDYTKINDLGEEVAANESTWNCVRDNHTGLIWQVKAATSGLHQNSQTFTWYDTETTTNGGAEGTESLGIGASCNIADCNTEAYVAAVNAAGLCGAFDWRMPSTQELYSIMNFGKTTPPFVDENYFPSTTSGLGAGSIWYWSKESGADGVANDAAQNAWAVDYVTGNDNMLPKTGFRYVRLVRAGK